MKFLFIITTISIFLFSKSISIDKINVNKKTIQLGTFIKLYDAKKLLEKLPKKEYYCIEKLKNYTIYCVNIKKTKLKNKIKIFHQIVRDAFVINKKNFWNNALIYDIKHDQLVNHKKYIKQPYTIVKKLYIKKDQIKNNKIKHPKNDFNIVVDKYKQALNHFKNQNYRKSFSMFNELFKNNLNDVNVNFYLGRSAFELKKYHESIIAYERVLFEKPNSSRTKFEMGRAYFLNKSYKKSKKLFTEVKNDKKTPINILLNINKYLIDIDNKVTKHFFDGILILGVNYESNINNRSKHNLYENVYIPGFNTYLDMNNSTEDIDAFSHQEILLLTHTYKYNENNIFKNNIMLFNKSMVDSKYSNKNIKLISFNPTFSALYSSKLTINYEFFIDNMWLDNLNYIHTYGIKPKINYIVNNKTTINSHIKYQIKKYNQNNSKSKNSKFIEFNTGVNYAYSNKYIFNSFITYSKEIRDDNNQIGIDNNTRLFGLSSTYFYKPTITFNPIFSYKNTKYKQEDVSYLKKVINKEYKFIFSSNYIYDAKWILQSNINYTNQKSNIKPNEYDKYSINLNILRTF